MDTSGTNDLHGPFMGGSWSVRIYETGYSHPVSDFTGDLAKVMSFPDAKNTTFKINNVQFKLPKIASNGTNVFQVSFTAQDFSHATYFCVNVFYNLDTGAITTEHPNNKEIVSSPPQPGLPMLQLHAVDDDGHHCHQVTSFDNTTACFTYYWAYHSYQFGKFVNGACPKTFNDPEKKTTICAGDFGTFASTFGIKSRVADLAESQIKDNDASVGGGAQVCRDNWPGSPSTCPTAVAICIAESGGRPSATNTNSDSHHSVDRGLWQINNYWHKEVTDSCAFNSACNGKAAYRISHSGSNWSAWSTFKSGAYKKQLPQATKVCANAN